MQMSIIFIYLLSKAENSYAKHVRSQHNEALVKANFDTSETGGSWAPLAFGATLTARTANNVRGATLARGCPVTDPACLQTARCTATSRFGDRGRDRRGRLAVKRQAGGVRPAAGLRRRRCPASNMQREMASWLMLVRLASAREAVIRVERRPRVSGSHQRRGQHDAVGDHREHAIATDSSIA